MAKILIFGKNEKVGNHKNCRPDVKIHLWGHQSEGFGHEKGFCWHQKQSERLESVKIEKIKNINTLFQQKTLTAHIHMVQKVQKIQTKGANKRYKTKGAKQKVQNKRYKAKDTKQKIPNKRYKKKDTKQKIQNKRYKKKHNSAY